MTSLPPASAAPVPVTVVCGFLGAGKSTLVNRLLREPGDERLGVLVNDFAAVNIDKSLIKVDSSDQIELSNGCVCCSIRDDLASGLLALARAEPRFTRIVLECSGVSHPAGVLGVLDLPAVSAHLRIDGVFCLIDGDGFEDMDAKSTELAIDQAAYSDLVLLNKADLAGPARIERITRTLLAVQPYMRLIPIAHADIPPQVLLGPRPATAGRPAAHQRPAADVDHSELYTSFAYVWDQPLEMADFQWMAAALPIGIVRAKGVLNICDGSGNGRRAVFHLVGKRPSLTLEDDAPPPSSELVLIGRKGAIDRGALEKALGRCPGAHEVQPRHAHADHEHHDHGGHHHDHHHA